MTAGHVPAGVLTRYVATGASLDTSHVDSAGDAWWWPVEVHLEHCPICRDRVRAAVVAEDSFLAADLRRVRAELASIVAASRPGRTPAFGSLHLVRGRVRGMLRGRTLGWARWWATPVLLPRLGMTALVVAAAVLLDVADRTAGRFPSLVLLLAPVLPLLGVAAAWSRGLDPVYELVVGSPRAGLDLVLRRAAVVLAGVIPILGIAGWVVGYSPARWLLPCLAFTVAALALGGFVGVQRAATVLAAGWAVVVVGPSLVVSRLPAVLAPGAWLGWMIATAVVAVVLVARRRAFAGMASGR